MNLPSDISLQLFSQRNQNAFIKMEIFLGDLSKRKDLLKKKDPASSGMSVSSGFQPSLKV